MCSGFSPYTQHKHPEFMKQIYWLDENPDAIAISPRNKRWRKHIKYLWYICQQQKRNLWYTIYMRANVCPNCIHEIVWSDREQIQIQFKLFFFLRLTHTKVVISRSSTKQRTQNTCGADSCGVFCCCCIVDWRDGNVDCCRPTYFFAPNTVRHRSIAFALNGTTRKKTLCVWFPICNPSTYC